MMKNNFGFTLAEVLITLGIIGVVAALTIPALVNNAQKKDLEAGFKKNYSNVSNVYKKLDYESGGTLDLQVPEDMNDFLSAFSIVKTSLPTDYTNARFFDKSLSGLSDYNKFQCNSPSRPCVVLSDGSFMGLFSVNGGGSGDGRIIVDTNGIKLPNRQGYDVFTYAFSGGKLVAQGYVGLGNITYWQGCSLVSEGGANDGWSNGTNCTAYAIANKCPLDASKTYWQCIP